MQQVKLVILFSYNHTNAGYFTRNGRGFEFHKRNYSFIGQSNWGPSRIQRDVKKFKESRAISIAKTRTDFFTRINITYFGFVFAGLQRAPVDIIKPFVVGRKKPRSRLHHTHNPCKSVEYITSTWFFERDVTVSGSKTGC